MNEPLTPPDCNCQGLPFMPLEVGRLVDSDLVALSSGDEFKAAVMLWAKSWTQIPAASLPDDDRILARMAGYSLTEWPALKAMALKGWELCSDGRLYHPLIADLAVKASLKRRGQAERANSRWAKARTGKTASAMPRHEKSHATASKSDATAYATAMQGTVKVEGTEPPLAPQGDEALFELERDETPPIDEVRIAFDAWNDLARSCGLPVAKTLDDGRRKTIGKRLASGGLDAWRAALRAVSVSRHCRGENDRGWRADLDFVCQAKSWRRLIEGSYGEDAEPPRPQADGGGVVDDDPWRRRVGEFQRNGYWNRLDWGPAPGKPGCTVATEILEAAGVPTNVLAFAGRPAA